MDYIPPPEVLDALSPIWRWLVGIGVLAANGIAWWLTRLKRSTTAAAPAPLPTTKDIDAVIDHLRDDLAVIGSATRKAIHDRVDALSLDLHHRLDQILKEIADLRRDVAVLLDRTRG